MPQRAARHLRIADARAEFLVSGRSQADDVPTALAASWQRSVSAGVDAETARAVHHNDLDVSSRLVRCAQPIIDRLSDETAEMPLSIVLSDNRARILTRSDTNRSLGERLDSVSLSPGFNYAEGSVGTNGIGTVFESGRSVFIVGPEHFHEQLQPFACAGGPIRDPLTGRVEGVLDISCLTPDSSPLMQSLVMSAAHDIERNLLVDRSQCQQALFETFVRLDARTRGAVMAIGGTVVMGNAMAQSLFDPAEQSAIREHARDLMLRHDQQVGNVEVSPGKRVRIRGTRIVVGNDIAGIVVSVEIESEVTAGSPASSPLDRYVKVSAGNAIASSNAAAFRSSLGGSGPAQSPLWSRAADGVLAALTSDRALLLMGEEGCGRSTLACRTHRHLHPEGTQILIEAADVDAGPILDLDSEDESKPVLLVFQRIDQLSTAGTAAFRHHVDAAAKADPNVSVVATISDSNLESDLPFRTLLSRFGHVVTVPSLRHHIGDLPQLAAEILDDILDDRAATVSPAAMRVLARYTWPRNVRQLKEALGSALLVRPVGEIQLEDLPGFCHSTASRQLSGLEAMERDMIVSALQDADGNRVQAAAALGIARSSLYRKLKSFGLSTI